MSSTGNPIKTGNSKITEAFELLNEAAKEKRSEMKELMTDRYSHIKRVAQEAIAEGGETVKKAAKDVDKSVHENPWPYLGGVAVVSLVLGYLMGSRRK